MSKRSSRRKRKEQTKKRAARMTAPVLTQMGKTAFSQDDYDTAIESWEQARHKSGAPAGLPTALAEAYFRRALASSAPTLADLEQAVKLVPSEPRYTYHLALIYHRLGQLEQAEPLYRQLLALSPPFGRAALPLAQLLIEKGQDPSQDPVWVHLSPVEQNRLSLISALAHNRPLPAIPSIPNLQDPEPEPADLLWHGLAAFAQDQMTTACQDLEMTIDLPELHPLARGVAHYYLGLLAARADQTEPALAHWQTAQHHGLDTPRLRQNMATLRYRQALAEHQAGHPAQALELLGQGRSPQDDDPARASLRRQLHLEIGYTAARQGRWTEALPHWQAAQDAGDQSRQLTTNLALAYEHGQQFHQAAELWREALRRRPRSATHQDALSDEQVAQLWQHIAENYKKADDYEQAITTYRNALKWSPDNTELGLDLVDTLRTEGRWQAADNELERILEQHPDHIPALTRQAEGYELDHELEQARHIWWHILEIDPNNSMAKPQLVHLYEKEGLYYTLRNLPESALAIYEEGLERLPGQAGLHRLMAATYVDLDDFDQAHHHFDQALALSSDPLPTLHLMMLAWLDHRRWDDFNKTLATIEALDPPAPPDFLLDLAGHCNQIGLDDQAWKLLKVAEQHYPNDALVLLDIAWHFYDQDRYNEAMDYLRRILRHDPNHAEANLRLGTIYYILEQKPLAKRHWRNAEQQARKENDEHLLYELRITKNALMHGIPPPSRKLGDLLDDMPPSLAELFDELERYKKS